jgi:hypothetical protein
MLSECPSRVPGPFSDSGPDWKFPAVARFAYGRPLAWVVDDFELRPAAKARFLDRREPPTLLVPVTPSAGMTDDDLASTERWLSP